MTTKDQERQAIEKIRKIVEGLGENSYVGFAMDGILELAEDNIREDTAYSMKERAEIAQKDARKAEKENKDLKAEIEDLKKTVEKRGATISELNTELCNARAEAKANEIPEELIQEMYCMAYDKEAESIGKMERAADQMTEATIAGEDAHGFAEEYKKQKENRNRYRKVMEMLDQRDQVNERRRGCSFYHRTKQGFSIRQVTLRESDIRKRTSRRGRKKKSDTRFRCLADAPKRLQSTNAKKIVCSYCMRFSTQ